jgi:tRNA(fMet)-specific endonuclease VapC
MTYALDANIISYLLKDNASVYERLYGAMDDNNRCIIPPVAYYEVKRGLLAINATSQADDFDNLCSDLGIGRMNTRAWDEAARLYALHRKKGNSIEDADLFIAAFCLVNGYTLVTHNTKHFKHIAGLQFVDWVAE